MISRRDRFMNSRYPARVQSRKEYCRFNLRAGDGHREVDRVQDATLDFQRKEIVVTSLKRRAEAAQRIDNTFHRPPGKGFIANKRRLEWVSCNQPGHEANGRSGVAGIQVTRGLLQSVESASFHRDCVGFTSYRNA